MIHFSYDALPDSVVRLTFMDLCARYPRSKSVLKFHFIADSTIKTQFC
ncbi:hypothetical protein BN1182_AV_00590 [Pantoea ananatis]|nr:hypothetical protein BN1182_AV_00590 [Pantoea ananatis]